MPILLICRPQNGHVNFGPEVIDGKPAPIRSYVVREGYVVLAGYDESVLHHDAEQLLGGPCGRYRMPTPDEQDRYYQAERIRGMIQEVQDA